jgi:hypothetical protein
MACTTPLESTFLYTRITLVHFVYAQAFSRFSLGNLPMISPQLVKYKGFLELYLLIFVTV